MKKIIVGCMCLLLVFLPACEKHNNWIFSLRGEEIRDKEVTIFGLLYAQEYNLTDVSLMVEEKSNGETYAEFHKRGLENEILSTVLLYREAKDAAYELSEEAKESVRDNVEEFLSNYGKEELKSDGIAEIDIERVFEMRAIGNAYAQSLSDDLTQKKEERYVRVLQVTFPTAQIDKNGMVQADETGEVVKFSEEECRKIREAAEAFVFRNREGEDEARCPFTPKIFQGHDGQKQDFTLRFHRQQI